MRHPAVARVAVAAKPQSNDVDLALVAYIHVVDGARLTPEAVRLYLTDRLPDHMVPALFIFLDDFPLTASGKLNRKALPDPAAEGPTRSQEFVAPRTPLETSIAEVWREVLDLDTVGVHDHFLEVGGCRCATYSKPQPWPSSRRLSKTRGRASSPWLNGLF